MRTLFTIVILALIVEKIVGLVKDLRKTKLSPQALRLLSLLAGLALTLVTKVGLLQLVEIIPADAARGVRYFDYLITGIIISRGSNIVHDIVSLAEKGNRLLGRKGEK